MLKTILISLLLTLSGCVFYRHDTYADGYDSKTYWSLFKNINIDLDPNDINVSSQSKDVKILTPYGIGETR